MAVNYQLLDLDAGNIIGAYPDEESALDAVRRGVTLDGVELWQNVALFHSEGNDSPVTPIAQGDELLARAEVVWLVPQR